MRSQLARMPFIWFSLAFIGGVLFANQVSLTVLWWLVITFSCFSLGILGFWAFRNDVLKRYLFLIPFVFFLGALRFESNLPVINQSFIGYYNDSPNNVWVTGTLTQPPDQRDTYANLTLQLTAIDIGNGDIPVSGKVLIRLYNEQELAYGQLIRARGLLETPAENETFSYKEYLARQGVHSFMSVGSVTLLPSSNANPFWQAIYGLNTRLSAAIYQLFPDPEASLLAGILLGNDNGLSQNLQDAFRDTGTTHIIAISGFNIAIIAGIFITLFSRLFGTQRGTIAALIAIAIYTLLVGASASVMRAAFMGSLGLIGHQIGRRTAALNTLAVVAGVMTFLDPHVPWDVGFQLSFAATLGLVLYAQPLANWAEKWLIRWVGKSTASQIIAPLSDAVLLTLAAQITTLPVIAYHFERISLISLIANPFILPAQPAVMILGGLAAVFGAIYAPVGQILAYGAWPFPAYTIRTVEWFASLPNGVLPLGEFSLLFVITFYAILLILTFYPEKINPLKPVAGPVFAILTLLVFSFLTWRTALNLPDGRLHLTVLNVGTGDAVLIRTPDGRFLLINGGPSPSALTDQLGRRLPPFNRGLDALIIASTQENQLSALPRTIEQFPPRAVYWSGNPQASFSSQQVDEWLTTQNIEINNLNIGDRLSLGEQAILEVVANSPRGAILLVSWGNFKALLPIGSNFESRELLENGKTIGAVTALLLTESGYAPANPPEWLDALNPQIILLSVEAADRNGLPDKLLLDYLINKTILRTDENGWIDLSTDGQQLWVEVENSR